jgi:hypothetical protein
MGKNVLFKKASIFEKKMFPLVGISFSRNLPFVKLFKTYFSITP